PLIGFAAHGAVGVVPLFCWLLKDALLEKLDEEIDALADDESALTDEERGERLAALAAELLQAERREELLIVTAEAEGLQVMRRPQVDPRALLGLSSALPAQRN